MKSIISVALCACLIAPGYVPKTSRDWVGNLISISHIMSMEQWAELHRNIIENIWKR